MATKEEQQKLLDKFKRESDMLIGYIEGAHWYYVKKQLEVMNKTADVPPTTVTDQSCSVILSVIAHKTDALDDFQQILFFDALADLAIKLSRQIYTYITSFLPCSKSHSMPLLFDCLFTYYFSMSHSLKKVSPYVVSLDSRRSHKSWREINLYAFFSVVYCKQEICDPINEFTSCKTKRSAFPGGERVQLDMLHKCHLLRRDMIEVKTKWIDVTTESSSANQNKPDVESKIPNIALNNISDKHIKKRRLARSKAQPQILSLTGQSYSRRIGSFSEAACGSAADLRTSMHFAAHHSVDRPEMMRCGRSLLPQSRFEGVSSVLGVSSQEKSGGCDTTAQTSIVTSSGKDERNISDLVEYIESSTPKASTTKCATKRSKQKTKHTDIPSGSHPKTEGTAQEGTEEAIATCISLGSPCSTDSVKCNLSTSMKVKSPVSQSEKHPVVSTSSENVSGEGCEVKGSNRMVTIRRESQPKSSESKVRIFVKGKEKDDVLMTLTDGKPSEEAEKPLSKAARKRLNKMRKKQSRVDSVDSMKEVEKVAETKVEGAVTTESDLSSPSDSTKKWSGTAIDSSLTPTLSERLCQTGQAPVVSDTIASSGPVCYETRFANKNKSLSLIFRAKHPSVTLKPFSASKSVSQCSSGVSRGIQVEDIVRPLTRILADLKVSSSDTEKDDVAQDCSKSSNISISSVPKTSKSSNVSKKPAKSGLSRRKKD